MRLLVLSDIHANLPAFKATLEDAPPFDRIWCLGDVVGYGPDPNECIELLNEYDHVCVAGNHDWASLGRLDTDDFNPDARRALEWTRAQLSAASLEYLGRLPTEHRHADFTIVHGSPRHPVWEYILFSTVAAANFSCFETRYCFVGHTHTPAIYQEAPGNGLPMALPLPITYDEPFSLGESRLIINPGSVGQPRNSDPRCSYLILDTDAKTITYRRVAYPVEETQMRMFRLGLPMRLAARLSEGW